MIDLYPQAPAARAVRGIPERMARTVARLFPHDSRKAEVLEELLWDDRRLPLAVDGKTLGAQEIRVAAEQAARECYGICQAVQTSDAVKIAIGMVCRHRGVPVPEGETIGEGVARAVDAGWWRRQLRKEWLRRFEHTSIRVGLTHVRTDPYVSRETAIMQELQNRANQKMLEESTATNDAGWSCSVADLAAKGTGDKTIRANELMARINGMEMISLDMGHVGMFVTITCPSEFHSVGGTNKKYNGATPRDGQAHLAAVWARIRSALDRAGIAVYGLRVAEPHTDGCPHWHTVFFMDDKLPGTAARSAYARASAIIRRYALGQGQRKPPKVADIVRRLRGQPDIFGGRVTVKRAKVMASRELHDWRVAERAQQNNEPGAKENRVNIKRIDRKKGSAARYIIKYVMKNIDGRGVGDHLATLEGGVVIVPDLFGDMEITPSMRVTYWSQVWGIRQFQQIGGAPVGPWRELRRIKGETVQDAHATIKAAHAACQKIESKDPAIAKQASFAEYIKAQGGPTVGRRALIKIATREITVTGRYATYEAFKPVGVYLVAQPKAVYESVRYTWTVTGPGVAVAGAFDLPRTGVNNCTPWPDRPTGGPAWTRPATGAQAPKQEKKFSEDEDFVGNLSGFAKANGGDGKGGEGWSVAGDVGRREQYRAHRKGGAELMRRAHLDKMRENHA